LFRFHDVTTFRDWIMNWYDLTNRYHARTFAHGCRLSSLPNDWQRELAALWRLEGDVNNGAYLQFFVNWGRETYEYASQALKKIGAAKMAGIVDLCQALVDEHFDAEGKSAEDSKRLLPIEIIDSKSGAIIKDAGSVLPEPVVARLYELSYEFMAYPDDVAKLGLSYYRPRLEGDDSSGGAP
jgi:hypothetical protein